MALRSIATAALAAVALLPGCDSATTLSADLGQGGALPAITAECAPIPNVPGAYRFQFLPTAGSTLPTPLTGARSLKVLAGSVGIPLDSNLAGTLSAPATLSKPVDGSPAVLQFIIDNQASYLVRATITSK
jgi:hypothetical protein